MLRVAPNVALRTAIGTICKFDFAIILVHPDQSIQPAATTDELSKQNFSRVIGDLEDATLVDTILDVHLGTNFRLMPDLTMSLAFGSHLYLAVNLRHSTVLAHAEPLLAQLDKIIEQKVLRFATQCSC